MSRFIVFVRHDDENFATFLGVFSTAQAARRKADAVNKRLPDGDHGAWAYVQTLEPASRNAAVIAREAMGEQS